MSLLDTAAQNASLDNDYGASKGANAPAAHEVALFTDHPDLGGTELTSTGGYARVSWTNDGTNWPAASGGQKTSATVTFPVPSGAWSDTATYWVLFDAADSTTRWDCGRINELAVDEADGAVSITCTVYYNGGI